MSLSRDQVQELVDSERWNGGEIEIHEEGELWRCGVKRLLLNGDMLEVVLSWGCRRNGNSLSGDFERQRPPVNSVSSNIDFCELQNNGPSQRIFFSAPLCGMKIIFEREYTDIAGNPRSFRQNHPELVLNETVTNQED